MIKPVVRLSGERCRRRVPPVGGPPPLGRQHSVVGRLRVEAGCVGAAGDQHRAVGEQGSVICRRPISSGRPTAIGTRDIRVDLLGGTRRATATDQQDLARLVHDR